MVSGQPAIDYNPVMNLKAFFVYALLSLNLAHAQTFPVKITIDAGHPTGPLKPIWRFFGADEPNYAYMKHGKELLGSLVSSRKTRSSFARTIS